MTKQSDHFTCEACKKTYPKEPDRTHDQMMKEHVERIEQGKYGDGGMAEHLEVVVVCDDCFKKIGEWSGW